MKLSYRSLFSVEVEHGYYPGVCSDISFIVPAATRQALAAGCLLSRVLDGRFIVLYESRDDGEPLASLAGSSLLFGLGLANPHFANFTVPVATAGQLALYANTAAPDQLAAPVSCRLVAPTLRVTPSLATRPVDLAILRGATSLATATLAAGEDEAIFPTGNWLPGVYTLRENYPGQTVNQALLLEPDLAAQAIWGALAITVDASFPATPPTFRISLAARQERLKYYVVTKNYGAAEFGQLNVLDAGAADDGRPVVSFETVAVDDFGATDLPPEILGDAASRIVLFQSTVPVPRRERGYRKLQLRRNNEVLVKHLPQAGPDRPQANFIVHLSKP
jgi:hypothetical protein